MVQLLYLKGQPIENLFFFHITKVIIEKNAFGVIIGNWMQVGANLRSTFMIKLSVGLCLCIVRPQQGQQSL